MRTPLAVLALLCAFSANAAPQPMAASDAVNQRLLVDRPRPEYPAEARKQRLTGGGLFDIEFVPETGRVRRIHVVQSTGHRLLDQSVITAVRQWRVKPQSIRSVRLPVTFLGSGASR
jgi:TonB family protein